MNAVNFRHMKPFISVMLIIVTLLGIVFLQMEERRMGYAILKLRHIHKTALEDKRDREITLAKITRPALVERIAQSRFTLKKVQASQIIHLTGEGGLNLKDHRTARN